LQADTATGSGFDILVLKHRNGKDSMKDVAEWMRERYSLSGLFISPHSSHKPAILS